MWRTEKRSRVFVSCILTPLPTDSSEANNSFTGFMKGKKKKKRTIFPEELGNNAKLSKSALASLHQGIRKGV